MSTTSNQGTMQTQPQETGSSYSGCVFNNQRVALAGDLVFTWVVYGDIDGKEQWIPISSLDLTDLKMTKRLMDYSKIFPQSAHDYVDAQIAEKQAALIAQVETNTPTAP